MKTTLTLLLLFYFSYINAQSHINMQRLPKKELIRIMELNRDTILELYFYNADIRDKYRHIYNQINSDRSKLADPNNEAEILVLLMTTKKNFVKKITELENVKRELRKDISYYKLKEKKRKAIEDSLYLAKKRQEDIQKTIEDSLYLVNASQTWEWLYDKKGKWTKVDKMYPKEEHYEVNSLFPKYQVIDMNAYLNGELVGVCDPNKNNKDKREQDYQFRERMMKFLCQQDYLNNKYNIKKEPAKTQEYIKLKLGLIDEIQPQQSPILKNMITNAAKLQAAKEKLQKGEISIETYNKLKSKLEANTSKYVFKAMSENESSEIEAGKRYLEQLKDDNSPLIKSYIIKRIDGTNFNYLFYNAKGARTLSIKVSFFENKDKEVEYKILPLQ